MDILDNEQSNFIAKLFSKLNKARKEFKPVYKSGTYVSKKSGHRYNYAQLSDYLEAIENGINGNNLYIMQPIIENKLLTQIVDCETGFIYTLTTIDLMKSTNEYSTDIQNMGGGITYLRKYSLQTGLFLSAEDDDGNADNETTINNKYQNVNDIKDLKKIINTKNAENNINKHIDNINLETKKEKMKNLIIEKNLSGRKKEQYENIINNANLSITMLDHWIGQLIKEGDNNDNN